MGRPSKEKEESWGAGQEGPWSGSLTYAEKDPSIFTQCYVRTYVLCVGMLLA